MPVIPSSSRLALVGAAIGMLGLASAAAFIYGVHQHQPHPLSVDEQLEACITQCGHAPVLSFRYEHDTGAVCICGK